MHAWIDPGKRMEGCLECAEPDMFDYAIQTNSCIVTQKNGKSYFHFADGLCSSSVAMRFFPSLPKSVRLLNTGEQLEAAVELLPEYFTAAGTALEFLHITGIPIDDLENEPVVIEMEW